jgi:aspartyl-tRNA synthetase
MTDTQPSLATPYRTHTCGELRVTDAGETVRLAGWVHRRRDHGQLIFLDLRDRHGITQVVIDKADSPEAHAEASRIRPEFVVMAEGTVAKRLPGTENTKLPTGTIELQATSVTILSEAKTPPFYINDPGTVYALPQSPQQLKQLLMVAGIDRYMQIARCYRDEDLRGDRQLEFTQLDLEMSFVDEASVMAFVEAMAVEVSQVTVPERPLFQVPFPMLTYEDALERYGSDKPDIRFGMELVDLGPALVDPDGVPSSGFGVFDSALAAGGRVKAIVAPAMAGVTRREIDELTERARRFGAKGLAHLSLEAGGEVKGPIAKFLSDDTRRAIIERTTAAEGDLILIIADTADVTAEVLGRLRVELGDRLALADPNVLSYVWIHRFPMYQWDSEISRWHATHNPFSGVLPEDEPLLVTASGDPAVPSPEDPAGHARALQYDLALNGWELGGGSIRIHRRDLLERSFQLQGHTLEGMREKFGAVLDAFEYGAPPHGGIALGIDRWAALLAQQTNIREVMAFPKTQSGTDPMLEAPSMPEPGQYEELGLRFVGSPAKRGEAADS